MGDSGDTLDKCSIEFFQASIDHCVLCGVMTELQGGKFGHGFASAFVSKYVGAEKIDDSFIYLSKVEMVINASIERGGILEQNPRTIPLTRYAHQRFNENY